ncbi:MAG: hypothetical protein AAGH15_05165 [Myxococcota bacterium]
MNRFICTLVLLAAACGDNDFECPLPGELADDYDAVAVFARDCDGELEIGERSTILYIDPRGGGGDDPACITIQDEFDRLSCTLSRAYTCDETVLGVPIDSVLTVSWFNEDEAEYEVRTTPTDGPNRGCTVRQVLDLTRL